MAAGPIHLSLDRQRFLWKISRIYITAWKLFRSLEVQVMLAPELVILGVLYSLL